MTPALTITIRPADHRDAKELARLRWDFRSGLAEPVESREAFLERCGTWMEEVLRNEPSPWRCWVAESEGRIVGQVWLELVPKMPNPARESELHVYVTNAYVEPALRGLGIGGQVLGAALEACRGLGVDAFFLWATPESRTLYARFGFREGPALMERRR